MKIRIKLAPEIKMQIRKLKRLEPNGTSNKIVKSKITQVRARSLMETSSLFRMRVNNRWARL